MRRRFAVLACALVFSVAGPAGGPQESVAKTRGKNSALLQITNISVGSISEPKMKLERAASIVFLSDGDVLGPGTETATQEIYRYDTVSGAIMRISDGSGAVHSDAARETDETHSQRPLYIAFISTADLDPSVGNADGNPELFLYFTESASYKQLTNTTGGVVNAEPYPSDGGQCIAFRSSGNLQTNDGSDSSNPGAGFDNADGSDEVFVLRFDNPALSSWVVTQVSNGPAGTTSSEPAIGGFWFTRQCRSTSYVSTADQLGNGSTGTHIYNYTKTSGRIEQLTNPGTHGFSFAPAMSGASNFARGPFVVFMSDSDIFGNGSAGFEIFRHRVFTTERIQYTFADSGQSRTPVISDGGGFLAFASSSEIVDPRKRVRLSGAAAGLQPPFNVDGNYEIFRTKGRRQAWQITTSAGCDNFDPSIQDNGRSIAFLSDCDHVPGENPGGATQLFVYRDIKKSDPLIQAANCRIEDGCCNEANGCYPRIHGGKVRPPKPFRD